MILASSDTYATFDHSRPLSWSAISSWEYSHEQWYRKYVLNRPDDETEEMIFGKVIGERLATRSEERRVGKECRL